MASMSWRHAASLGSWSAGGMTVDDWHARERPSLEVGGLEHCWDMWGH